MDPITILSTGEIALDGQFLWGSNYTLLVGVVCEGVETRAVYKPTEGVRPLWDFEVGSLARREVLAYLVSEQLGWELVPPTVYREDGPMGPGSVQLFVDHDPKDHFFNFTEEARLSLRPAALFDVLINNADRKGGHFIRDGSGHIWLIDHGVCFHEHPKLRTVLWDFAGESVPDALLRDTERFLEGLSPGGAFEAGLNPHLSRRELAALRRRAGRLLEQRTFPHPPQHTRPYPWPLI